MPEELQVLLDQNVPRSVRTWLAVQRPDWEIHHTSGLGLQGASDAEVYEWAQEEGAIILTFDEDFADQRSFPVEEHAGVIRLRIWPTTVEETRDALQRLLDSVDDEDLEGALVIVGRDKIRIREP